MQEIYLTKKELSKIIETSPRTIENWGLGSKVKQNDTGKYELISSLQHQLSELRSNLKRKTQLLEDFKGKEAKDSKALRLRKLKAETEKEEAIARIKNLEADQLAGTLVEAEQVLVAWENYIANCKAKLLALPSKLALELAEVAEPNVIEARLSQTIDESLKELIVKP